MWLTIFFLSYFIVLPNRISCQPVTDDNIIRYTRQTNFEECCPCSRDDGTDFREQDMSPSSRMGSFVQEADDGCPCRSSGIDSQGSSSIFRPFILRASNPSERERESKQGLKPLLQPEVGLASSVLETIQKATDEEYQEALARDAARNLVEREPGFLDSEPGNSRNSVTIVLNSRDDLYDGDDPMAEASHVHETRCIHGPLGISSLASNDMVPRMSKQNSLLKRKPVGYTHKSLFDMDNSASNIKESFDVNNSKVLGTKLRMNPMLLNKLPTKTGEEIVNNAISRVNSRYELRTITPEYSNDLTNNELNNKPKFRLAALKNRLRELVDMRNIKRLNNNVPVTLRQNNLDLLSNIGGNSAPKLATLDANPPLDELFDKASPVFKNILKLKDVELLPPIKSNPKDLTVGKYEEGKHSDLNIAGTENDVMFSNMNEDKTENSAELDTRKISNFEENVGKDRAVSEEEAMTSVPTTNSDVLLKKEKKLTNPKDVVINEMQQHLYECLKSVTNAQGVNKNAQTDIGDDSVEYDSKEAEDDSEMEDSVAETSDNIGQQLSQEDNVDSLNLKTQNESEPGNYHVKGYLLEQENEESHVQENDGFITFKNDILRKLENIKKTIKSKLQDTDPETITKPIVSQPEKVNTFANQDISNSDLNPEGDQNIAVTLNPQSTNEKEITIQDLQNLSDSLLEQENSLIINSTPLESTDVETKYDENSENQDFETPFNTTNDSRSVSSEFDFADTEIDEDKTSSEDDESPIYNESTSDDKQVNNTLENSKYTYDTIDNENDDIDTENTLPKDSITNEMSSQASNSKYNTISPPLSDNNLRSPTLQDTFNLFKTPLQIPSLEEIRQGITDIIDAGQQESEEFQQTELDPLNESSNRNSMLSNPLQSNLPKTNYLGKPLTDRYLRPLQNAHNNIAGYKSILDNVSLKPLITEPFYSKPSPLSSYPLTFGPEKAKSAGNQKLKSSSSSDATGISSLDDIRHFFETNNYLNPQKSQLSRTNIIESPTLKPQKIKSFADDFKLRLDNTLKPDLKKQNQGNQLSSKPRIGPNDFLQTMSKKHEGMKERLQALHLDFNDRLASIYKKLNDQKKIQSVNIPRVTEKGKSLALPTSTSKKERNGQNLFTGRTSNLENNVLSQPQILQEQKPMKKKITPKANSVFLKTPLRNNHILNKPKASIEALKENENVHINKFPNLSEYRKHNMDKQKSFTPISNIKISFTTTTSRPLLISGSELQKSSDIKMPARFSEKGRTADLNSNLNDISKAFRSRLQSLGDSSHAPSELIETTNLNEASTNYQFDPVMGTNKQPRIDSETDPNLKETLETPDNPITKKAESPLISNLREALRARLENVTRTHATPKTKNPVEATNLKEVDTIVLPSNVETSVPSTPLKENTSYKCTIVCSRNP